jgi:hypothetical protein
MSDGFIRLSRKFFENEYWTKERSYSQAEAWLDLIQASRFEAEPTKKTLPNGRQISIERGEVHASLRYLSARWGWGLCKVHTFIKKAVKKHQIEQRIEQGENVITLCKYNDYNPIFFGEQTPIRTPNSTPIEHRPNTGQTNNKKEKKEKKEKKNIIISPNGDCETEVSPDPDRINYQDIINLFHSLCPSYSKVQKLTESRKSKMKTRINEFKKQFKEPYMSVIESIFTKMEASGFMKGDGHSGWKATFDWVFVNGSNWVKVYEGNYDNNPGNPGKTGKTGKLTKTDFIDKLKEEKEDAG